jgi:hypothetical protein
MSKIPTLRRLRLEDCEFEASLGYIDLVSKRKNFFVTDIIYNGNT